MFLCFYFIVGFLYAIQSIHRNRTQFFFSLTTENSIYHSGFWTEISQFIQKINYFVYACKSIYRMNICLQCKETTTYVLIVNRLSIAYFQWRILHILSPMLSDSEKNWIEFFIAFVYTSLFSNPMQNSWHCQSTCLRCSKNLFLQ